MGKRKFFVSDVDDPAVVKEIRRIAKIPVTESLTSDDLNWIMKYCDLENVSISNAIAEIYPKSARAHSSFSIYRRGAAIPLEVCTAIRRILRDTIAARLDASNSLAESLASGPLATL